MSISCLLTSGVMSDVKFSADIREEFGKWMQQERESRGLTQKYVAEKMGLTVTQLSRIENSKSGTERDTVILWAQVIGIDINEALRRFKPETTVIPKELAITGFEGLDDDDLADIAEYVAFKREQRAKMNAQKR